MSRADHSARVPLSFLVPGVSARVDALDASIDAVQREQLVAYGVAPGRTVTLLQQRPMTLLMIDEVELALEDSVARHIWVIRQ